MGRTATSPARDGSAAREIEWMRGGASGGACKSPTGFSSGGVQLAPAWRWSFTSSASALCVRRS
eukprot:7006058-Pyramimonas_sp.AAC.1